jgi:hypothetical protein
MLRSGAPRSLARSLLNSSQAKRSSALQGASKLQSGAAWRAISFRSGGMRSLQPYKPATLALVRHAATRRDAQLSDKLEALQPHPEEVSTTSSVQTAVDQIGTAQEDDADMMAGVKGDMVSRQILQLRETGR